jgi:hypothetical protein
VELDWFPLVFGNIKRSKQVQKARNLTACADARAAPDLGMAQQHPF